jgi:hypothetical protein
MARWKQWLVSLILFSGAVYYGTCYSKENPLIADFCKISMTRVPCDTVRGTIFSNGARTLIKVYSPRKQFMQIDSTTTFIYNPGERSAIKMHRSNPALLPFFELFRMCLHGGQFPPLASCTMGKTIKGGDSLCTDWIPDGKKTSMRGRISTLYFKDRLVDISSYDKKGALLYQAQFSRDSLINGLHVPLRIVSKVLQKSDTLIEEVSFQNVRIDIPIPPDSLSIIVPPGVRIEVLKW